MLRLREAFAKTYWTPTAEIVGTFDKKNEKMPVKNIWETQRCRKI